jgi:hypothetical protein
MRKQQNALAWVEELRMEPSERIAAASVAACATHVALTYLL